MANEAIIVLGIPEVAGALERYPEVAGPEWQAASDASLLGLIPEVADYPSAPANSSYRRTGTLGRLWTSARPEWRPMANGFEGSIGNATPYGHWVQGEDQARRMGAIGWVKAEKRLQDAKSRIEDIFRAAARRIEAKLNRVTM